MPRISLFLRGKRFEMYLYRWLCNAKNVFGSETLFGVIIVVFGRVFCQDDCGVFDGEQKFALIDTWLPEV